jgi:hypothetical protein
MVYVVSTSSESPHPEIIKVVYAWEMRQLEKRGANYPIITSYSGFTQPQSIAEDGTIALDPI